MIEGGYYHVFNRGNNGDIIFYEEENYDYFLKKFRQYLDPFVDVFSYCLMNNHFHFLIRIKENEKLQYQNLTKQLALTPIEKAFRDFFISYAKSINKKYHRTGSLFQYKFKRKQIEDEIYLKNLIRYIHLNPVEAGICSVASDYNFSSFNAITKNDCEWLGSKEIIEMFEDINNFKAFHLMENTNFELDFQT
ncbi:MAG: transposase [Bacteroidetes bacterium]|nr:transposase [Bacteroidota bacterium]